MNERVVLVRKWKGNAGEMGQLQAGLQTGCVRSEGLREHSLGRIHPGEACHRLKQGRHFCLAFPNLESGPLPAWAMKINRRFVHIIRCHRGKRKMNELGRGSQQQDVLNRQPRLATGPIRIHLRAGLLGLRWELAF